VFETQTYKQIPTGKANKVVAADKRLQAIIDDPNSTDQEVRQAEKRAASLANLSYSGINQYTDPNSKDFIPELEGASKEQVHEYTKNLGEWSDDNTGGYRAKNPKQQKLWENLTSAVDFEHTETGEGQTRRQEMLDKPK
jgi:hypothetical protein